MSALPEFERVPARERRIIVKAGKVRRFVREADIRFVTASGNYALVHASGGVYRVRMALETIETVVDPELFARVHRSTIVNLRHLDELRPIYHGEFIARMSCGAELRVSRSYSQRIHALLTDAPLRALP